MRRLSAFFIATALTPLAAAPPGEPETPEITAAELLAHVRTLASDEFEGRGSGTKGEERATEYVAEAMKKLGLEPLGEGATLFQTVDMPGAFHTKPGCEFVLEVAGGPIAFAPGTEWLPLSASADGEIAGEVVFAGYGIRAPEFKYDDYAGLDVKGKIVVVLRNAPEGPWWADPSARAKHAPLLQKLRHAAEMGAKALIVANDPRNFGAGKGGGAGARPDAAMTDEIGARLAGIPYVHLTLAAADRFFPAAFDATPLKLEERINTEEGAVPVSVPGKGRVKLVVRTEREMLKGRNVCALLRARAPGATDEIVVIGAHHDHVGRGGPGTLARSPEERREIHNGADDNASGVAGVLEAAQYLAARQGELRRSVLFLTFTGEERGLLGSIRFVGSPTVPLSRIVAMVNLDMIGRLGPRKLFVGGVGTSPGFRPLVDGCAKDLGVEVALGDGGRAPSDNTSFYSKRIPVLWLFTGMHSDYHRPADDADKIDGLGMEKAARLAARLVEELAKAPQRPTFVRSDTGGEPPRAVLGIVVEGAQGGVKISRLQPEGPAAAAGLKEGDVIVAVGGEATPDLGALRELLFLRNAGDKVRVKVRRGEKEIEAELELARG